MAAWTIMYYKTRTGGNPVYDFINALDDIAQGKVARTLDLLAMYNIQVREPHAKKLTGLPLWELRIMGKNSIRIFYVSVLDQSFLLLHAFEKRSRKTPRNEIEMALSRLSDWNMRIEKM